MEQSKRFPALRGRQSADVAVVGGGMSGLCAALWLSRAGLRVAVLEARRFGGGISAHCAGSTIPFAPESLAGAEAETLTRHALSALESLRGLTEKYDLGWREAPFCLLCGREEEKRLRGVNGWTERPPEPPFSDEAWFQLQGTGVLNMNAYLACLLEACESYGCRLYEHSRVVAVETDAVLTEKATLLAPYIVIATGYPIVNVPGWYFLRMEQRESLLLKTKADGGGRILACADGSFALHPQLGGVWMQLNGLTADSRKSRMQLQALAAQKLRLLHQPFPNENHLSMEVHTADGLPFAGIYSPKTPNLFVAAGYGGAGILGSMIAAKTISAHVLGLPTEAYRLYAASRPLPSLRMPLTGGFRYANAWLHHPRAPRCPHMGCRLRYDSKTRLWICPCHGSRFDDVGRVLNAPAVREAVLKDRR